MKRATRPRWFDTKQGWYCDVKGKRYRLAGGPRGRETWAAALVRFWSLAEVPVKEIVRGVDWVRLAGVQWAEVPEGPFSVMYPEASMAGTAWTTDAFWHRRFALDKLTAEQVEGRLIEAGVSREMMALFVPMPA